MADNFNRSWILENALEEIQSYEKGVLTLRGLHYRLVARGMINSLVHYKRVVSAMTYARWEDMVPFETFSDNDRGMIGETVIEETVLEDKVDQAKRQVKAWMRSYHKNRWENQPIYLEVFIEKKALQGVFQKVTDEYEVALGACKGYPSLTFLHQAAQRFKIAEDEGKDLVILYFGDYDPSGEDIPRSLQENLERMGVWVDVRRVLLTKDQVIEWNLPPAPVKSGDTRSGKWDGIGQVELDAVEPKMLQRLCAEAIDRVFDYQLHDELIESENSEREDFQSRLKDYVVNMDFDD
jgi:hypothetical protein